MIDTHAHILFGIDDGSRNLEMSMQMLEMECEQGVTAVFCTSHNYGQLENYRDNLAQLQREVERRGLPIKCLPGCEIDCSYYDVRQVLEDIDAGLVLPMGNSNYLLLEFHPLMKASDILHAVKVIKEQAALRDGQPIQVMIAHIERYGSLCHAPEVLTELEAMGCLFQINAYSLVKESKDSIKNFARQLLAEKRVSFIGSDAHRIDHRPPAIKDGIDYIYAHCNKEYADAVCYKNAERLM